MGSLAGSQLNMHCCSETLHFPRSTAHSMRKSKTAAHQYSSANWSATPASRLHINNSVADEDVDWTIVSPIPTICGYQSTVRRSFIIIIHLWSEAAMRWIINNLNPRCSRRRIGIDGDLEKINNIFSSPVEGAPPWATKLHHVCLISTTGWCHLLWLRWTRLFIHSGSLHHTVGNWYVGEGVACSFALPSQPSNPHL